MLHLASMLFCTSIPTPFNFLPKIFLLLFYIEHLPSLGTFTYNIFCVQVQEDGLFSLDYPYGVNNTARIFPFWDSGDIYLGGSVKYLEIHAGPELEQLSSLIRANQRVNFVGIWALVAEWKDIPKYSFSRSTIQLVSANHISLLSPVYAHLDKAVLMEEKMCPYSIRSLDVVIIYRITTHSKELWLQMALTPMPCLLIAVVTYSGGLLELDFWGAIFLKFIAS